MEFPQDTISISTKMAGLSIQELASSLKLDNDYSIKIASKTKYAHIPYTLLPHQERILIKNVHFQEIWLVEPYGCKNETCKIACQLVKCLKSELASLELTCDELLISSTQTENVEGLWPILKNLKFKKLVTDEINKTLLNTLPESCEEVHISYFDGPLPSNFTLCRFKKVVVHNGGEDVLFDSFFKFLEQTGSSENLSFLELPSCGKIRSFESEDFIKIYIGKGLKDKMQQHLFYKEFSSTDAILLSQEEGVHRIRLQVVKKKDYDSIFSVLIDFLQDSWSDLDINSWTEFTAPIDFSSIYEALKSTDKADWHTVLEQFVSFCGLGTYSLDEELEEFETLTLTKTSPDEDPEIDWERVFDEPC